MPNDLTYLACPYTHPDIKIRIDRFEESARAAAYLIHGGRYVYSPITMTHPIDLVMATENETMGSDYWVNFDEAFMVVCSEMIILTIQGWNESRGIAREKAYFESAGKSVKFLEPNQGSYRLVNSIDKKSE